MASNTRLRSKPTLIKHLALKNKLQCRRKTALLQLFNYSNVPLPTSTMKKYISILASAALLAACEQKTETTEPAASPTPTTPPPAATGVSSPATTTESPAGTTESPAESPPSQ
ncbi:MAG: hypothetical protein DME92_12310 [Verrucomicrobia bacterium]|nr:MAG: hypothetical protein DME92_12310 [Verrucomicrobiota bacterium]